MLLANTLLDVWLAVKEPSVHLWSFVDNLEITTTGAESALRGTRELHKITDLLDLRIDPKKTYSWANNPEDRKKLKNSNMQVKLAQRDLGGTFSIPDSLQISPSPKKSPISVTGGKVCKITGTIQSEIAGLVHSSLAQYSAWNFFSTSRR